MALTRRPSGLASTGYYKDHADYLIFCGGWNIGRIYEIRSGPEMRWFWALHFPGRPENLSTDRAGHWKRRRSNSKSAGASGRCGPSWKRYLKLGIPALLRAIPAPSCPR
jgi:hypothetical protein